MDYDEYNYSNNSYTDSWEDESPSPPVFRTVVLSLVTAVSLMANVLLLVVLRSAPPLLNTTTNVIFLQRAIADMFSSITMVFFIAGTSIPDIMMTGTCLTFSGILHVGAVASVVFLMAFTIDSYQAAYPQQHPPPSRRRTMRIISALGWLLAAAAGIAALFLSKLHHRSCYVGPFFGGWHFYMKLVELVVMFLIPLIATWVLVSVALRSGTNSLSTEAKEVDEKGPNRSLMLGLTITFTVTHCIFRIFEMVALFGYIDGWILNLYFIAVVLPTLSEAANPILVICLTEDLKQKVAGWLPSRRHSTSLALREL